MHAQCAFRYDSNPRGMPAACAGGCDQKVSPPRRLLTRFGKPGARCTAAVSAPLYYCFPCATAFTQRHRQLLVGHVGMRQAGSNVAWGSAGLFGSPAAGSSAGGPPPLPKDRALRQAYVECFRFAPPQSEEEEQSACDRHADRWLGHALHDSHATLQRFRDGSRDAGSLSIYLRYIYPGTRHCSPSSARRSRRTVR